MEMDYPDNSYISTRDLSFRGVLQEVKKARSAFQPIFEAFTNSLEAIKIKSATVKGYQGKINIEIFTTETTIETPEFDKLTIRDSGIGFDDKEFKRFNTYRDFSKGFKNLGSGRIQFTHYFEDSIFHSVFQKDGEFWEREFVVSKKEPFLRNEAIVFHQFCKKSAQIETGTKVTFRTLIERSPLYNSLNDKSLKQHLIERYIHYFCVNKAELPEIEITFYLQNKVISNSTISAKDIPDIEKSDLIELPYCRLSEDGKSIEKINRFEEFSIDSFKISSSILAENGIKLLSKGEIVKESGIELQGIASSDIFAGKKYLFLISSDYIDSRDSNERGELSIPNRENFSKKIGLFTQEEILLEDIQDGVNKTINSMYPEIEEVKLEHSQQFDRLKEMFLLDDELAKEAKISMNDSESKILTKIYELEAKKTAELDASIKESIDRLDELDTTAEDYEAKLEQEIESLSKKIPQQNKNNLTHYVARRKLVLDLFGKILNKKLLVQNSESRDKNEALIHNLLFQQGSENPENSDLWIINEDFVFFKGTSESRLSDIELEGEKIFKDHFSSEEAKYLSSLGENRKMKKPDVLLFPDEGKCIILEFKNPNVNVSDHLNQINFYASLIRNFTKDEFQITTFYGYLIGEGIEERDVRYHDSSFVHSYHLDYLYRPSKPVVGDGTREDGSIYTEVLKYSTLLARAIKRNQIFMNKLLS
jgi:hypothetical protein